jgi:hypothetical protein
MQISVLTLRATDYEDYVEVLIDGDLLAEKLNHTSEDSTVYWQRICSDTGLGWLNVDGTWPTVFDKRVLESTQQATALVLNCGCNIVGCYDTHANVVTTETSVEWRLLTTKHVTFVSLEWTFDRNQYREQVELMHRHYQSMREQK